MTVQSMAVQRQHIEDFLYREARLIDERRFNEWLDLFTQDAIYWVPCNEYNYDPTKKVSIIYDNWERLEERIWRLNTGQSPAQLPASRTRHLITNVEMLHQEASKILVSSNFILAEHRRGVQSIYAGRYEHHLMRENDTFKIRYKKVELLNNNDPMGNLSFIF